MTDAPGQILLPIDESLPKERLRRSMLLLVGAAVVLIHLLLVTVFTPLKPDPAAGAVPRADRTTLYVSSRVMDSEPLFLKMLDTFDPASFLHPPEEFGFSFFRTSQAETGPEAPFELPLPEKLSSVPTAPQISLTAVSRPLLPEVPDYDSEAAAVAAPVYPYWAADTASGVVFPAFRLGASEERSLQRQRPSEQSVFLVKTPVLPDLPFEAVLEKSCGIAELDLSARAWLDTLLNSSECPAGLKNGGFCRVVWSAESLRKEASVR
jgi:hypothetical protein